MADVLFGFNESHRLSHVIYWLSQKELSRWAGAQVKPLELAEKPLLDRITYVGNTATRERYDWSYILIPPEHVSAHDMLEGLERAQQYSSLYLVLIPDFTGPPENILDWTFAKEGRIQFLTKDSLSVIGRSYYTELVSHLYFPDVVSPLDVSSCNFIMRESPAIRDLAVAISEQLVAYKSPGAESQLSLFQEQVLRRIDKEEMPDQAFALISGILIRATSESRIKIDLVQKFVNQVVEFWQHVEEDKSVLNEFYTLYAKPTTSS